MKSIWIVQPYVPTYRVPFFERLTEEARRDGIDVRVVSGTPDKGQAARGDVEVPAWLTLVRPRSLRIAGRSLILTSTAPFWKSADGVVLPLIGSSLDVYSALARKQVGGISVGLWGHVKNYTSDGNPLDLWLEKQQMRASDQVFAYTTSGADYARRQGIDQARITTVANTVDLDGLRAAIDDVSHEAIQKFRSDNGIVDAPAVSYIGGIDESKRISFLVEVLDELWRRNYEMTLLVGGQGAQLHLLEPAIRRGQVVHLGKVGDVEKALMAKTSTVLLCPGRVGLVAVEALAMGLHVLTTRWPYHAPEFDYLKPGKDVTIAPNDVGAVADELQSLLSRRNRGEMTAPPEMPAMVENFLGGLRRMLDR